MLALRLLLRNDVEQPSTIHLLAAQQRRITGVQYLDLAQHLPHDDFDVLVVDLHALQAVHILNFAHQVIRQRLHAL